MSVVEAIRELLAKGFSIEQALTAAEAFEPKPTARQERNKRYYQKRLKRLKPSEIKTSEIKTLASENVLIKTPLARVVDNLLPIEISGKKENKKGATRPVCSRLHEDFKPSLTMRAYAKGKGLTDGQIDSEGEAMRDWSLSSPNGLKLDWEATWRGWIKRKVETKGNGAEPPPRTLSPQGYVLDSSKPGGVNFLAEPKNRRF